MPLSAHSPAFWHVLQNLALIAIALALNPFLTFLVITSSFISPFLQITKSIKHIRQWRAKSSCTFRSRTILVTGVGMSKGLTIARSFYRAGHRVIGADFEPHYIPVCGRFSKAVSRFYRLHKPSKSTGTKDYINDLITIVKKEKVELWVSCSGVASAIEDGKAKEALDNIGIPALQFGVEFTSLLHDKDSFIKTTKRIGLNVPETHLITSTSDTLSILYPADTGSVPSASYLAQEKAYIFKSVGMDDSIRADMTILPLATDSATREFISRFKPSLSRPFVLQEYIKGPEYCTHSVAIHGKIKIFTACASSELLMHYKALSPSSNLFKAMLRYTTRYAEGMGTEFTGHFSMDFLLQDNTGCFWSSKEVSTSAEIGIESLVDRLYPLEYGTGHGEFGAANSEMDFPLQGDIIGSASSEVFNTAENNIESLMNRLFPIECNPRAHTAAILFADQSEELSNAYLSLLPDYKAHHSKTKCNEVVVPSSLTPGYYWIGHDIITTVTLPIFQGLRGRIGLEEILWKWLEFLHHLLFWRDGTWEVWDPWPIWWLYAVYWPGMFFMSILQRNWWSRCNVSTTKIFRC